MSAFPILRVVAATWIVLTAAGCGSGMGHVESLLREIHPGDAVAAAGVLLLTNIPDVGWTTRVAEQGGSRYRIAIEREVWSGAGDGEFNRRFGEAARHVAETRQCGAYLVLAYAERYEGALLGVKRIAEGLVECRP